jgi:hypothetical protein
MRIYRNEIAFSEIFKIFNLVWTVGFYDLLFLIVTKLKVIILVTYEGGYTGIINIKSDANSSVLQSSSSNTSTANSSNDSGFKSFLVVVAIAGIYSGYRIFKEIFFPSTPDIIIKKPAVAEEEYYRNNDDAIERFQRKIKILKATVKNIKKSIKKSESLEKERELLAKKRELLEAKRRVKEFIYSKQIDEDCQRNIMYLIEAENFSIIKNHFGLKNIPAVPVLKTIGADVAAVATTHVIIREFLAADKKDNENNDPIPLPCIKGKKINNGESNNSGENIVITLDSQNFLAWLCNRWGLFIKNKKVEYRAFLSDWDY